MRTSSLIENPEVAAAYSDYSKPVQDRMLELRELVIEIAEETDGVVGFAEALRWGEPSFITKSGSTVRINEAGPGRYALYFNCQSKLVDTFRALFPNTFRYEGNRAIVFDVADPIPTAQLQICISLALTYHKRKHLEMLGA